MFGPFRKEKPLQGFIGLGGGAAGVAFKSGASFSATGGTMIPSGGNMYHVFSYPNSDNFVVSGGGSKSVEILVVAGGAGGAAQHGGGGGAGGVLHHPGLTLAAGTYPVTVGAAGAPGLPGPGPGNGTATYSGNGGDSYFGPPSAPTGYTADGGGGGFPLGRSGSSGVQPLVYQNAPPGCNPYQGAGLPGGSGGGTGDEPGKPGGASTQNPMNGATGYGNAGGDATGPPSYDPAGGGGAGSAGSGPPTGNGGNGQPFTNFPGPVLAPGVPGPNQAAFQSAVGPTGLFGGGGGRGSESPSGAGPGAGGPGGGGAGGPGGNPGNPGNNGVFGTGGGGGGSSGMAAAGGSGGAGIVILKYPE